MGRRGQVLLLLMVSCAALTGCFGGSYSPSYFPFYLPPGDIIQTHAKPPGRGYFSNFDPKAVRLELKPDRASNPTKTHQVLIATIYDKDGDRRRKRRVEWILDGPGFIVEVDESGFAAGRGYLIDNKRAVSYTELFERNIKRGNEDPRDDFTVLPGQTWCIVSCAVEGQTTVTAYAPAIYDRDKSTVTTKLIWSDSQFQFPPPQVSRSGGEVELSTKLFRYEGHDNVDGLKVRYRIVDGAPASLVSRTDSNATTSGSGIQRETEVETDADGVAPVRVVQPLAQSGKTRIIVEVVKPDGGTGTVVDRRETSVEWATANLGVNTELPKYVSLGRETPVIITVSNTGKSESQPVTLRANLPDGVEYLRASPEATTQQGGQLTWKLGPLAGNQKLPVKLTVKPTRMGNLTVNALAETPDGLRSEQRAFAGVDRGSLKVALETPETIAPGDRFTSAVLVTNASTVPVENVTAWLSSDSAIEHPAGVQTELSFGTLAPGQSKRLEAPLLAKQVGRFALRAALTADGGLQQQAEVFAEVQKSAFTLTLSGSDRLPPKQEGKLEVRLRNVGQTTLRGGALLRVSCPKGLRIRPFESRVGPDDQLVELPLNALPPGAEQVIPIAVIGTEVLKDLVVEAVVIPGAGAAELRSQHKLSIEGQAALTLQPTDWPDRIRIGAPQTLRYAVWNAGTGPARNVELAVTASPELKLISGSSTGQPAARLENGRLIFSILPELAAGGTAVFQIELDGLKTGQGRLGCEVRAEHLRQPLREDQPLRVR